MQIRVHCCLMSEHWCTSAHSMALVYQSSLHGTGVPVLTPWHWCTSAHSMALVQCSLHGTGVPVLTPWHWCTSAYSMTLVYQCSLHDTGVPVLTPWHWCTSAHSMWQSAYSSKRPFYSGEHGSCPNNLVSFTFTFKLKPNFVVIGSVCTQKLDEQMCWRGATK